MHLSRLQLALLKLWWSSCADACTRLQIIRVRTTDASAWCYTQCATPCRTVLKAVMACTATTCAARLHPRGAAIAKHALLGFTKNLREELKEAGIRVTAVLPGPTLTASWEGVDLPAERFIKAEDVAEAIFGTYRLSAQAVVEELLIRPQLGDL